MTGDGTTSVGANCAIVTAHDEAAASGKNVLKCISAISAELQHAPVETYIGINIRGFEIEVVPEDNWGQQPSKKEKSIESSRLSLITSGSSMNAAFGGVSAGGMG